MLGTEAALLPPDELGAWGEAWDDLARRTLEPNVFLSPWMAKARLRHLPDLAGARALVAWRGPAEARQMVGLALLVRGRGRHLNPFPLLRPPDVYAPLSTPLLAPEAPAETWGAILDALSRAGIAALALPLLGAGGPVAASLREAAEGSGRPIARLGVHERAFLDSTLAGAAYVRAELPRRRRREASRQRNRLSELGALGFAVARSEAEIGPALETFLRLEASGWKGRAGTDLATASGGAAFMRDASAAGAGEGAFRVVSFTLGERVVAAGLVAVAGGRAFYVKTAYDEEFARYSPGFLLTLDLTEHLLDDPAIATADSVALADHPMIDRIWTARQGIESLCVATRSGAGAAFAAALAVERGREGALRRAKAMLGALRRKPPVE